MRYRFRKLLICTAMLAAASVACIAWVVLRMPPDPDIAALEYKRDPTKENCQRVYEARKRYDEWMPGWVYEFHCMH